MFVTQGKRECSSAPWLWGTCTDTTAVKLQCSCCAEGSLAGSSTSCNVSIDEQGTLLTPYVSEATALQLHFHVSLSRVSAKIRTIREAKKKKPDPTSFPNSNEEIPGLVESKGILGIYYGLQNSY